MATEFAAEKIAFATKNIATLKETLAKLTEFDPGDKWVVGYDFGLFFSEATPNRFVGIANATLYADPPAADKVSRKVFNGNQQQAHIFTAAAMKAKGLTDLRTALRNWEDALKNEGGE